MKKKQDKLSFWQYCGISMFPVYGFFYYFNNKDDKNRKKSAKTAGQLALLIVVLYIVSAILKKATKSEKTINGVLQNKLTDFVNKAIENKKYKERLLLGYVNTQLSNKIKHATGYNLQGYDIYLYAHNVRHIFNSHQDTEMKDFEYLIKILEKPQIVTKTLDKNGFERIKIVNFYDVTRVIITELHITKDYLTIITMFKD